MYFLYIFSEPFMSNNDIPHNNEFRLQDEVWFHGSIGRQQAEALLHNVSILYMECVYLS